MKFRPEKQTQTEATERELADEIRRIDREDTSRRAGLSDAYWQNLLIRTNARIDEVSSPRALGLSWLLRVALPGVFAVLSFVIALHYYVPTRPTRDADIVRALQALPPTAIDSMTAAGAGSGEMMNAAELSDAALAVSGDQIEDFFLETGNESQVVETMGDTQAHAFLDALAKR